jgi:hypothetical protein
VANNSRRSLNSARLLVFAVALVVSAQSVSAQDLSRYRDYVLESSVASVRAASGVRAPDARTLHERPAKVQEIEWRAPYVSTGSQSADPVRGITFLFADDALYQLVVSYDRDRTDGLTGSDIIASLTGVYGEPLKSARARAAAPILDTVVLAQWDSPASSLTLVRGTYSPEFQLVLISKAVSTRARSAIREATRLDALDAPRRELEKQKKEVADATAARDKTRTTNKDAFRP